VGVGVGVGVGAGPTCPSSGMVILLGQLDPKSIKFLPVSHKINDCLSGRRVHTAPMRRLFKIGLILIIANELRGLIVVGFVFWNSRGTGPECQGVVKCLRMPYIAHVDPTLALQLLGITLAFGFVVGLRGAIHAKRDARLTSPASREMTRSVSRPNPTTIPSDRQDPSWDSLN